MTHNPVRLLIWNLDHSMRAINVQIYVIVSILNTAASVLNTAAYQLFKSWCSILFNSPVQAITVQ